MFSLSGTQAGFNITQSGTSMPWSSSPINQSKANLTSMLQPTTAPPEANSTSILPGKPIEEKIGAIPRDAWTPEFTFVFTYGIGFSLWVGTVCNLICLIVMLRKRLRSSSTTPFLIALAVADTLVLWAINQREWFHYVFGRPLVDDPCYLMAAVFDASSMWSSWCVMCVTIERFIAVRFPLKASSINRPVRARVAMVILPVGIWLVGGVPNLLQFRGGKEGCVVKEGFEFYSLYIHGPYRVILAIVIPSITLFTLNILIVYQLRRKSFSLLQNDTSNGQTDKRKQNTRKITIMVLTISTTHLVLTLPASVFMIIMHALGANILIMNHHLAFVQITLEAISYFNHTINFFLYVISSPKFRSELVQLVTCEGRIKMLSGQNPNSTTK